MIDRNNITKIGRRARRYSRGGYLYIAVLFTALIVAASVTAALSLSTGSLSADIDRINRHSALRLAETEIHRIASSMNRDQAWRTDRISGRFSGWRVPSGVQHSDVSLVRSQLTDEDGDLADDPADAVELTTHARVGKSQAAVTVLLEPRSAPLAILNYGVTAFDDIQLESAGTLSSEWPIQVGDDCKSDPSGVLTAPTLECNGKLEGSLRCDLATAEVVMPTHDVIDEYVQEGTQINIASLPWQGGKHVIEDVLLTANNNPYGTPDPAGIYWIDANRQAIRISHSRIEATVAIKNANSIEVTGGLIWTYAADPEAILVADTDISFVDMDAALDELVRGVNFNPPSRPYRQTFANLTASDRFPTELRGVIFTTRNVSFQPTTTEDPLAITGSIICKDLSVGGHVVVRQLSECIDDPPLGLIDPIPLQFVRGTFRRIPTP